MEADLAIGGLPASPPETPADISDRIISDGGLAGAARYGGHNVRPHGGLAWDPPHGGHNIKPHGDPAGTAPYGGHNVRPHGGLAWGPPHGGHDGTPPSRTGTDTLLGLSNGMDDAIQELDNELNAVRGRLRTLSMQRTQRVRADIHKTLSDRSSPLSDTVISAPKRKVRPTHQPPRTATVCEGEKVKTENLPQSDRCRCLIVLFCRVYLMLLARVYVWGGVRRRILRALPQKPRPGREATPETPPQILYREC